MIGIGSSKRSATNSFFSFRFKLNQPVCVHFLVLSSFLLFGNVDTNQELTENFQNNQIEKQDAQNITALVKNRQECLFEEALKNYSTDQICQLNIDLRGDLSWNNSLVAPYQNCRVIAGFVSLRQFYFDYSNQSDLVFPHLELIKDFLFIRNFHGRLHVNITLGRVFPRLRTVFGYSRIENITMYISKFQSAKMIALDSLTKVCGPVLVEDLLPYQSFRHSSTYWRLMENYRNTKLFNTTMQMFDLDLLTISALNSSGFYGKFKLEKFSIFQNVNWKYSFFHILVYEIDSRFYRFVEHGGSTQSMTKLPYCNDSDRLVFLSDFDHTDKQRMLKDDDHSQFDMNRISQYHLINIKSISWPLHSVYENRIDTFDICHIRSYLIERKSHKPNVSLSSPHNHWFSWEHVYMIKLELCDLYYESCDIQNKFIFLPHSKDFSLADSNFWERYQTIWILIIFFVGLIIFFISLFILALFRFSSKSSIQTLGRFDVLSTNPDYGLVNPSHNSVWSWPGVFNYSGISSVQESTGNSISYEIDRSKLKVNTEKLVGKGEFGFVYQGLLTLSNNNDSSDSMLVAVKILKNDEHHLEINKEKLIIEAKQMMSFNSNFLVKIIGISTTQEPIFVVMEYLENGDLKRFLRQRYAEFHETKDAKLLPAPIDQVLMAIQIADGMYYLHTKKVIHRDLAARNCMVSKDMTVKLGDFGLARCLYEKDYYRLSEEMPMPLRWMAPESVRQMIFTEQSDVWSYGVLLWEIMSFGEQPYRGRADVEVKEMISTCRRLERPTNNNYISPLWTIAQQCWRRKPSQRPSFSRIIEQFRSHLPLSNRDHFDFMSYCMSSQTNSTKSQKWQNFFLENFLLPSKCCFRFQRNVGRQQQHRLSDVNVMFQKNGTANTTLDTTFPSFLSYKKRKSSDQPINKKLQNKVHHHHHYHPHHQHFKHRCRSNRSNNNGSNECSSLESLPSSDYQSEITAITSLSSQNYNTANITNCELMSLISSQMKSPDNNQFQSSENETPILNDQQMALI